MPRKHREARSTLRKAPQRLIFNQCSAYVRRERKTMIHTTDTTARALYDAMQAAALENLADEAWHEFKHDRLRMKVLHKNLRATAAKVLKNWAAFGGGQKPKAEKTAAVTWPAGALSVFRAAMQDGDLAGAVRIGREKLGLRAYEFKDGPMLAFCPVPVPEIGDGFALLMLETGYYSVTDMRTGLKIGTSFKTRTRTLESASARKAKTTPEAWAQAMAKLSETPTAPDVLADWCALHGVTLETAAPAPEIEPVAPVSAPVATTTPAPAKTAPAPAKRAACKQPTPADRMARRASARKRQQQRAIAGQLAPHLVANLERNGLLHNGQATRRGRFLYLDDATI